MKVFYYDSDNVLKDVVRDSPIFMSRSQNKPYYYNDLTGEMQWEKYIPTYDAVYLPKGWILTKDNAFYNTTTKVSQWKIPTESIIDRPKSTDVKVNLNVNGSCEMITGLEWTKNSCYMDSVLHALFAIPNDFTSSLLSFDMSLDTRKNVCQSGMTKELSDKYIQDIQQELRNIADTIRGKATHPVKDVTKLRHLIKKCPTMQNFSGPGMQDSGEFLSYMLNLFPGSNTATTQIVSYGTNNDKDKFLGDTVLNTTHSVVISVVPQRLLELDMIDITDFLVEYNDSGELTPDNMYRLNNHTFRRRVATTTLIDAPIVIFNINRRNPEDESIITTSIIPIETFALPSEKEFSLSAIVVFVGGCHYTCYYNCNSEWYLYDDMANVNIVRIGTYDDLIENTDVMTDGTTFYYIKK